MILRITYRLTSTYEIIRSLKMALTHTRPSDSIGITSPTAIRWSSHKETGKRVVCTKNMPQRCWCKIFQVRVMSCLKLVGDRKLSSYSVLI